MKLLSPYVEFMYGARFDRKTLEAIKNEKLKIVHNKYVVWVGKEISKFFHTRYSS